MTACIVGWAHTPFGKLDGETVESLIVRVTTQALAAGFDTVKVFPAEQAGGIKALRALAGPFPHVRFCPTGGIGAANAATWLAEPNVLCVGGSWLCPAADIRSGNWAGITAICNSAMKSLKRP